MIDLATWPIPLAGGGWLLGLALATALGLAAFWLIRQRATRRADQTTTAAATDDPVTSWHSLEGREVLARLATPETGLDEAEVERRRARHGPNRLPEARSRGPLTRFLAQFHNVLIYVLIGAGVVVILLQHWVDAAVIFGVVLINAIIGFIQEGKAEDALRAIRQMLSPHALVLRDGVRREIGAEDLVPGDLVPLQTGDRISADLRLIRLKGLQVDESALTGESLPVEKDTAPCPADTDLADRRDMAYSGTLVTRGQGLGVVIATGAATEIGRISALVADVRQLQTPLLRQVAQFGRWLTGAILALAALTFAFGVLVRGNTAPEMFLAAVGLAVAAIPEGLPAIMTITLAIGVRRMAGRNAIIRRLPAVETLGTVGVICSDKTGTLTRNEMTVETIALAERQLTLSGSGYDPHGGILHEGRDYRADGDARLHELLRAVALCNDSGLVRDGEDWRVNGDPMEGALLVAALKGGLDPAIVAGDWPRTDLIPFESEHQFMATLHHSHAGEAVIYVKGAPERILEMCAHQRDATGESELEPAYWQAWIEKLAASGQRVLAVAVKPVATEMGELTFADVDGDLTLLGLLGLMDPPRPEAIAAVERCRAAGIRVKMITGDHASTARAIAAQLDLVNPYDALTGGELEALDDEALREQVARIDVYARVTPEHKLRLVSRLQERGHIVAMTGDGVNDAPALKRADVGIAMGDKGTEVAKEAAEMVLADDNFASIAHAVEEGRTVYDNLMKSILFILPTNGGEALIILGAILLGFAELPITPVQILWVNMITAVTLALALAFEPPERGVMRRPPRNARQPVLTPFFLWRILFVSLILMAGTFSLFLWELGRGAEIEYARTVAVNTLVMFEIFYLFNARYIIDPVLNREGLLGNRYVLIAIGVLVLMQLALTYAAPMHALFQTAALDAATWGRIVLIAASVLFLVEAEKAVVRRWLGRR
ncbi:cation-transporting P-type ATPase [Thiococcus pfennigii]|uniref:cation-transporting P-type ATPase n=1 Tax=Thiococcus pfennigii TaxID=1057 RepID=UPI001904E08A|nr:cation-transporting P-type ATPase [Thiococcus pfennigii]MBK1733459.1 carbonate dehydratase [Thiococcus pfennigii]